MKWLLLLSSLFLKPMISSSHTSESLNPIAELKDLVKENASKVAAIFASAIVLSILFASGIVMALMNISAQYDVNAVVYFNTMIGTGLGLSVVSFLIGFIALKNFQREDTTKRKEIRQTKSLAQPGSSHPLQDAIALFITDMVKEKEFKRNQYAENAYEREAVLRSNQVREEQELTRH
jgi:hypothetical protein